MNKDYKVGFRNSFNLNDDWVIDEFVYDEDTKEYTLYVSHAGGELVCPETGEKGERYDCRRPRRWRHMDLAQCKFYIHCRVPRVKSSAGIRTIAVPWAKFSNRYTYQFECWTIDLLKRSQNQAQTAEQLRCGPNVVYRILSRAVARGEAREAEQGGKPAPTHLCMDDKSFGKGWNKYATVVSDGERGHVLDLTEGRDEKSASALVERLFPKEVRDRIETMTTDLGWAYIRLHRNLLSKALLIHDRFHLVQLLNRALNDLRKREVNQNPNLLKGSRYALLKNPENRTEKQEVIFQAIMDSTLKVGILWQLRESFKAIFRCSSPAEAMTYLKLWLARARETGIQQADRVANTFEKHLDGVCNALYCEQSNARAERINGKIQQVITIARGFRSFQHFRVSVLFYHGNLSLYP